MSATSSLPGNLPLEVRSAVLDANASLSVARPFILVVGWRDSNHDDFTRAYRYCAFWTVQKARRAKSVPPKVGYVLFARFLGHAEQERIIKRLRADVGYSTAAFEIRPIKEILRYVSIPKPESRPSIVVPKETTKVPAIPAQPPIQPEEVAVKNLAISLAEERISMESKTSEAKTPTQALQDILFLEFANRLAETIGQSADKRISTYALGRLIREFFPHMPQGALPAYLQQNGYLAGIVTPGANNKGYYGMGVALAGLVGIPLSEVPRTQAMPEHPLARKILELEREVETLPTVQAAKAEAQAKLDEFTREEQRLLKIKETLDGLKKTLDELK